MDAVPSTVPDCIASIVFLPMGHRGASRLIAGSCDVFTERALSEIPMPAAIAQPLNTPLASTMLIFVAVPRSITIQGRGYFSLTATAVAIRSVPSWEGDSISIIRPALFSTLTQTGSRPVIFLTALHSIFVISVTTQLIIAPLKAGVSIPFSLRISSSSTAY